MRLIDRRPDAGTATTSLDLLAARARRGDRRAAAALRARMTPQARQLALALGVEPRSASAVVRRALYEALDDRDRVYSSAVVAAVQRHGARARGAAPAAGGDLQQAVGVLCDVQGHSHDSAAALLGQSVATVVSLHRAAREGAGVDAVREHCRGWFLVSRPELTPPEQAAADGHLQICRSCREALAARAVAQRRMRAAVPVGGTALGGVVAALSTLGGGSVAAGTVAAGTAAVLGAGALVAVAPPEAMRQPEPVRPASVSEPVAPAPTSPAAPVVPAPAAEPPQDAAPPAAQAPAPAPAPATDAQAPAAPAPPPPSSTPAPLLEVELEPLPGTLPGVEAQVPQPSSSLPTSIVPPVTVTVPPLETVTEPLLDPLLGG